MPSQSYTRSALSQIVALQFLTFAARGFVIPFLNLYLTAAGFSGTEIGVLTSLGALIQLVMTPALNSLADRAGRHRRLFYVLVYSSSLVHLALIASTNKFVLSAVVLLRSMVESPVAALLSQLTITWLNDARRSIYGRLRAWGSLGWGVTTLVSGRIFSIGGYPFLFILAALSSLLTLPFVRALPPRTSEQSTSRSTRLPRRPEFYVLMASALLYFVGMNAVTSFGFIFFQRDLKASNEMIGILASIAALAEIPAMVLIDFLLRRTNAGLTLALGALGMAGTWLAFAFLTDLDLLIPLMIVRGTFYTLHTVSITLMVSHISHPANAATNQALSQATIPALALLLTGSASGWIFDHLGPRVLFELAGMTGILSAVLLIGLRRYQTGHSA